MRIGLSKFETEMVVKNQRDASNQIANLPQPVFGVIDGFVLEEDWNSIWLVIQEQLPETELAIILGEQLAQLGKRTTFYRKKNKCRRIIKMSLVNYVREDGQSANNREEYIAEWSNRSENSQRNGSGYRERKPQYKGE